MRGNGERDRFCLKKVCQKLLYYVVTFSLIGLLFAAIINTLITYNKWPIYTEVLVVPQKEAKHSAITMCPISDGYKEDVLQVMVFDLKSSRNCLMKL